MPLNQVTEECRQAAYDARDRLFAHLFTELRDTELAPLLQIESEMTAATSAGRLDPRATGLRQITRQAYIAGQNPDPRFLITWTRTLHEQYSQNAETIHTGLRDLNRCAHGWEIQRSSFRGGFGFYYECAQNGVLDPDLQHTGRSLLIRISPFHFRQFERVERSQLQFVSCFTYPRTRGPTVRYDGRRIEIRNICRQVDLLDPRYFSTSFAFHNPQIVRAPNCPPMELPLRVFRTYEE